MHSVGTRYGTSPSLLPPCTHTLPCLSVIQTHSHLLKVYGPHIALLYASPNAASTLDSLAHYFHTSTSLSTTLNLASSPYELVAALPSITAYIGPSPFSTWSAMASHEELLSSILLTYLRSRPEITIYGHESADKALRVPVISFSVKGRSSKDVVESVEKKSAFGVRWGHFYSKRLVDDMLGLEDGGVVRVSMVHYNTEEEIRGFVGILGEVLKE